MAQYDQGGGCPCGLYKVCSCEQYNENNEEVRKALKMASIVNLENSYDPERDTLDGFDAESINDMVATIGRFNVKQGWRRKSEEIEEILNIAGRDDLIKAHRNYLAGTMIALLHSELSEALEGLRKDLMDDHLTDRKQVEAEMADVLIRLFDFADHFKLDLGGATVAKDYYNHHRDDHREHNRNKPGGKSF